MTLAEQNDHDILDMAHLQRQTMGDAALRAEVLGLFLAELDAADRALEQATASERAATAHALKGAALGVGAFALADAANALETASDDDKLMSGLRSAIRRTRVLICEIGA